MTTIRTGKTLLVAAVLAGSLLISSISGFATQQAFAEKPKKIDPNLDIKSAYIDGNNLVVKVKGTAGGSVPPRPGEGAFGQVYGYVFILADGSKWVLNAHWECHPESGCHPGSTVSEWHAEQVTLGDIGEHTGDHACVTSIFDETMDVTTKGHIGTIHVFNPAAITKVQTVAVQLLIHPDTAPSTPDGTCVGYVLTQFDAWTPKDKSED